MSEILEWVVLPFQLPFMQNAFLVTLMILLSLPLTGLLYHQSKKTAGR